MIFLDCFLRLHYLIKISVMTIVITMPAVRHVNNKSVSIEHLKTSLFSICMVHLERLSKMTTVGSMNSCYEFGPLFLATKGVALLIAFSSNARVTIKSTICKASVICSGLFVSIFTRWRSWLLMFFSILFIS